MVGNDRREHIRTAMSAKVKVVHAEQGEFIFSTRDISDGGVFIVVDTEPFTPSLGDKVTVQVQGLPVPAPVLEMVVVRKTNDGYGLQFDPGRLPWIMAGPIQSPSGMCQPDDLFSLFQSLQASYCKPDAVVHVGLCQLLLPFRDVSGGEFVRGAQACAAVLAER